MGLSSIGMSELVVILLIVMLLFGTKRLKTLGSDLGGAIRGFRRAMGSEDLEQLPERPALREGERSGDRADSGTKGVGPG